MSFSDFLFARGGFLAGMGSVLDLRGSAHLYNYALTPEQADVLAMYADWRSVGQDLKHATSCAAQQEEEYQPMLFDPNAK